MHSITKPEERSVRNPIHITSHDKQRLEDLLAELRALNARSSGDLQALAHELERAVVVDAHKVPQDVITMNSRAELVDLDSGETARSRLFFHQRRTSTNKKISVLAPIGAGMLGYRVGDEFEWKVPQGVRRMKVTRIYYQPEAGDFER